MYTQNWQRNKEFRVNAFQFLQCGLSRIECKWKEKHQKLVWCVLCNEKLCRFVLEKNPPFDSDRHKTKRENVGWQKPIIFKWQFILHLDQRWTNSPNEIWMNFDKSQTDNHRTTDNQTTKNYECSVVQVWLTFILTFSFNGHIFFAISFYFTSCLVIKTRSNLTIKKTNHHHHYH